MDVGDLTEESWVDYFQPWISIVISFSVLGDWIRDIFTGHWIAQFSPPVITEDKGCTSQEGGTTPTFPIQKQRKKLIQAVRDNSFLIVTGNTGSGKTTQLPKYLYEAGNFILGKYWEYFKNILLKANRTSVLRKCPSFVLQSQFFSWHTVPTSSLLFYSLIKD